VSVNPVPLIVTIIPTGPLPGVKLLIVAAHIKLFAEVTVPLGVATEIVPVAGQALAGTLARMRLEFRNVTIVAEVPLN